MILEQILLLPYMTIEPSFQFSRLTILYWVVCTIMLDAVSIIWRWSLPISHTLQLMMERCCKLNHQMVYCASWLCCNTGIMRSRNKSISWNDQAHKYSVGHHLRLPWMMVVVIDLHKTSNGLEQAILYSSDFLRTWSCKLCNVEIEDHAGTLLLHCTRLELFFGLKYPNTTLILSPRQCCQTSIPTAPHGTHVYDCKGVRKLYTYTGLPFYTADIGNFFVIFHFSHVMAICSSFCTSFHHLINQCY